MTTTITVETHSFPVAVTLTEHFSPASTLMWNGPVSDSNPLAGKTHQVHGYRSEQIFVPVNTKRVFHIHATVQVQVQIHELPEKATDLSGEVPEVTTIKTKTKTTQPA